MYFAHGAVERGGTINPVLTVILVTLAGLVLMLAALWALKHLTTWEFPSLKKDSKS